MQSSSSVVQTLYEFTDRLFRAGSLEDICDAALDAIACSLRCERSAVLLFDDTGTMRFVAYRGLSDNYRRAVEGHSPWTRDTKDPQPICMRDIDSADIPEPLTAIVKAEGIGALAFVPLVAKGELIGKFMTYYDAPHVFGDDEVDLALTIARQLGFGVERMRADEVLRQTLAATQRLQGISTRLIQENDPEELYKHILDAAVALTGSDFASIQKLYPERGELKLLAHEGFNPAAASFWKWVRPGSGCTCAEALRTGERVIVYDVESCEFLAETDDLVPYRSNGIRAVQSTPLVCRNGIVLGMMSTHWRKPHRPSERELGLLDVLARQAADLIERNQSEQTAQRHVAIIGSSHDAIVCKDLTGVITSWNRGAEQLFGYTAEEVIGRPITLLMPADRHNDGLEILERIKSGEHVDHYETVRMRKDGRLVDISLTMSPVKDASGKVIGVSKIARDISERNQALKRQELLVREIQHRTKNLFAVVHAVVSRSFAGKHSVEDAEAAVLDRLHSLAQTHVMLIDKDWEGADLAEVVRTEMSPYRGRVTIEGPSLKLTAKAAQNFALAVHELATNAAKYGALSTQLGRVHITWSIGTPNGGQFMFRWQERGGPHVTPPTSKGFGSAVLEQVMAEYFEKPPRIEFVADGVCYEVVGSLEATTNQADLSRSELFVAPPGITQLAAAGDALHYSVSR